MIKFSTTKLHTTNTKPIECHPKQKAKTILHVFESVNPNEKSSKQQIETTEITFHIIKDIIPFNTINKKVFKNMIQS